MMHCDKCRKGTYTVWVNDNHDKVCSDCKEKVRNSVGSKEKVAYRGK